MNEGKLAPVVFLDDDTAQCIEMTVKNIITKHTADPEQRQERLEAIKNVLTQSSWKDKISLRIYQAEEDPAIFVEKWIFDSDDIRKNFLESDGIVLGPWPEGNHDHALGDLSLDSDNLWEE